MEFKYFFTRKLVFIKETHTTVLLPGGFGTIDEGFENLAFFQMGKCMPRPIVLLDHEEDDYWDRWLD
jgi:predicted Rossmann-fold nucleotide-binding protein